MTGRPSKKPGPASSAGAACDTPSTRGADQGTRPAAPWVVVPLVAAGAALLASVGVLGADLLWAVPLGQELAHGHLPRSIAFASALTAGWHDVPAVGQLVVWAVYDALGGERGLLAGQVLAVAAGFAALAEGLRREAPAGTVLVVSAVVLAGSLPAVAVAGIAAFSLALLPLLRLLLALDESRPDGRLWLAVPLLALWGNLHGGALVGWALLACYLVLSRGQRSLRQRLAVLGAATLALAVNPALWHTPSYYRGVLGSEPARRSSDLWAQLGSGGFDVLLVAAALVLLGLIVAGRRIEVWEIVALAGLTVATVHVARTGVFLLAVAAYPAARGLRLRGPKPRLLAAAAAGLAIGVAIGLVRNKPRPEALVARAAATGEPVLATSILAGEVAAEGGRVWVSNPIDAFHRRDQRLYLDWLGGSADGAPAVAAAGYVLAAAGSAAAHVAADDPRLRLVGADGRALLFRVKGA